MVPHPPRCRYPLDRFIFTRCVRYLYQCFQGWTDLCFVTVCVCYCPFIFLPSQTLGAHSASSKQVWLRSAFFVDAPQSATYCSDFKWQRTARSGFLCRTNVVKFVHQFLYWTQAEQLSLWGQCEEEKDNCDKKILPKEWTGRKQEIELDFTIHTILSNTF